MSYDHAEYFDQISDEQIMRLVYVNAVATTKVCGFAFFCNRSAKAASVPTLNSLVLFLCECC